MDNEQKFNQEFISIWQRSEEYEMAYKLWVYYHFHCESFDRAVCTGRIEFKGIMPENRQEYALINSNANNVRQHILEEARKYGLTMTPDWDRAKKNVLMLSWEGIQKEYERLW